MELNSIYAASCIALIGYILIKYGGKLTFPLRQYIFAYCMTKFSYVFCRVVASDKERLFAPLSDLSKVLGRPLKIVEIGPGSGTNFQFYPPGSEVLCVDPNKNFEQFIEQSSKKHPHIRCIWINGFAEDLRGIPDNSVDAVVGTLVLCSVNDIGCCFKEIERVLRKDGKYYFMEHVMAKQGTWTHFAQHLLAPTWKFLMGGCSIKLEPKKYFEKACFSNVDIQPINIDFSAQSLWVRAVWVHVVRPLVMGIAVK